MMKRKICRSGGEIKAEYGLNYSPLGFMNVDPPIRKYDFSSLPLQPSTPNYNTNPLSFNTGNIPLQQQGDISQDNLQYKQTTDYGYLTPYLQGINFLGRGIANQKNIADREKEKRFTQFDNQQPEEVYFNNAYRKGTYASGGYIPKFTIGGVLLKESLEGLDSLDFPTTEAEKPVIPQAVESVSSDSQEATADTSTDLVSLFKQGIVGPETGGKKNYTAANKTSTAYGAYQFLKATRLGIYNRYLKDKFTSAEEFEENYKTNPEVQEEVMDLHSKDLLSRFGGNMEAAAIAHFGGEGKAQQFIAGTLDISKAPTATGNITYKKYLQQFAKAAGIPSKFKRGGQVEMDLNDLQIQELRDLGFDINI